MGEKPITLWFSFAAVAQRIFLEEIKQEPVFTKETTFSGI